jgi:LysR family transcriptional regulator, regulator for metE and metH
MILEVKHLQLVEAIAEFGTLTNAGKHLNLTQSALSHQLVELERRLCTPLFHRVGRRLVPTVAGDRLLRSATRTLTILRRTEAALERIAAGREAVVRFSTECYTAYHWLSPLLAEYARRCPKVEVEVVAEATRHPIDALLAGRIDVGVGVDFPEDDRIDLTPLFEDELVLITATSHKLASREYVTAADLAKEHLFVYSERWRSAALFRYVLEPAGVTPQRVSTIQLTEAIVEMVKAGLGVAALASWSVEPYVSTNALAAVRLAPNGIYRRWQAATLKQQTMSLHIREFCRLLAGGPPGFDTVHHGIERGARA